jgi:peptidoglycan/LPS O-acetylase OafA/YrhL
VVTGNTRHTQAENRVFYPALDGLRAVAFLMVFLQHYYFLPWGWTGVNVFFVLSGFLITGILFDTRDDLHRARNFYVRRTLRIFPLYYGIMLVLLLLNPVFHWRWNWYWTAWPLYLGNFLRFISPSALVWESPLFVAADAWLKSQAHHTVLYFGHFWSLCVEEQFYLMWPWVVFWTRKRRTLLWICGCAVVVVPLLRVWAQASSPDWMLQGELLYRVTPFQLDSLLLGGLVALLWRGRQVLGIAFHAVGDTVPRSHNSCLRYSGLAPRLPLSDVEIHLRVDARERVYRRAHPLLLEDGWLACSRILLETATVARTNQLWGVRVPRHIAQFL